MSGAAAEAGAPVNAISVLYLSSGDEFYVALPYDEALGLVASTSDVPVAMVALRWLDPDGDRFDEHSPLPVYTETQLAVRPSRVEAVESCGPYTLQIAGNAREVQAARGGS